MVMVIAFWNLNQKELSDYLVSLALDQDVDILVLAEAQERTIASFLLKSTFILASPFNRVTANGDKLAILTTYAASVFEKKENLSGSNRWLIYEINLPGIFRFNLAAVHFHSKINWAKDSLALECVNFSRDISKVEGDTNSYETILIGDFNMNPFEDGVVAANGLNAIQDLEYVAVRPKGRKIDGTGYRFFYNPMWNFFGDHRKPFGTHYHRTPGHVSQEWNMYDQAMFRGSIKKYLNKGDYISIIDTVGADKLTSSFERPDKDAYSDHLPIVLKLNI